MNLFQLGDFTLNSGLKSNFKIDCDALTDDDVKCLAYMISKLVGPFSSVQGVPTGGLRLEEALRYYQSGNSYGHLLCDDVCTTGKSMNELKNKYLDTPLPFRQETVSGAVIFNRGTCPSWIIPLFSVPPYMKFKEQYD